MPISLPEIESAAHSGAFGRNRMPEPTENQCNAGNYKMGRFDYHGLKIVIEQPRGSYRTGIVQKTGKRWTSRMAAHYGYVGGTKGADGDGVDCFVGFYPQSEHVFVINQNVNGRFDEHKSMLAFPDQESAIRAYKQSYDRYWKGLASIAQLSINQFKWWLKNGDMSRPIKQADLPAEGFETMKKVYWNENNLPIDGRTLDRVLYEMRQSDEDNLLMDSVSMSEILEDSEGSVLLDALVTPFVKLERKMSILQGIMERSASQIKPIAMQISDPFKQSGVVNVAVVYELSDGQTISIYFHNPDVTPQKIAPTDEVISWKWMLNKKDITIVVAPERGRDLDVREVARRILKLAEKNSAAFARANAKRADRMQNIQNLKDEIVTLEGELKSAQNELEVLKIEAEGRVMGGGLIIPDEEQQALKEREDAARTILENMDADQLAKVGASPSLRSVVTLKMGADKAIDSILENHPDDVETAIASVVSGSGESEETPTDQGDPVITLSGKELGDFPDTAEGAKQLRLAAKQKISELIGKWVPCPALKGDVEIRKSGVKKTLSLSADTRKLKLVAAIELLISSAKELNSTPPYSPSESNVTAYHTMRSLAKIDGEDVAVRFVIKEDDKGKFHWDHTVHAPGAILDSANRNGPEESDPISDATYESGGSSNPSRLAGDRPYLSKQGNITAAFDSVDESKEVFNLFIEGEEPEVIGDDGVSEEAPSFQIGDYVIAVKDVGFYGKDEMRINHIKTDYDSNKQMLKLEDKGSQYWNASDFKLSRRSDEKPKDHEPEAKPNAAIEDVNKVMPLLKQFIGKSQLSAVGMGIRGEEKQYFIDKMLEIANTIQTMPKTYGQDGMGDKAIAYLHYFKGSADWHITEKDMEDEQLQAFGLADLFGDGGELGYISIEELIGSGVELDFNWKPKTIGEIMGGGVSEDANIGRSWRDGQGDEITIESLKDGKYYALMNGKVNGGPIIPVDDLERFIELDSKQYQDKLRRDALRADEEMTAADEKLRKEKEFADVGGNPMQKGKAIAELSKMIGHNGVVKNKRQFVEDLVSGGENTSTYEEDKIKPMSGSAFFRATDQQQREHEKKVKEAGKVTRYMLGVYEVSKSEYDYANILIQKRDSAEESQEDGSTNINDMRGMSFAIERDGSILTSGAVPELADKNDPTSSFDYYKNLAIQMKGNLYIGDRNKSLQTTTDNNELIFGMTWGEIQSFQQGKSIDRSVISMLPENPILVYSSKGVDGSINASRSFLQSVVDGTADMDAETFPDQIEKAAEELGDGDVLVIQAANAYADYITKKSKELLS